MLNAKLYLKLEQLQHGCLCGLTIQIVRNVIIFKIINEKELGTLELVLNLSQYGYNFSNKKSN